MSGLFWLAALHRDGWRGALMSGTAVVVPAGDTPPAVATEADVRDAAAQAADAARADAERHAERDRRMDTLENRIGEVATSAYEARDLAQTAQGTAAHLSERMDAVGAAAALAAEAAAAAVEVVTEATAPLEPEVALEPEPAREAPKKKVGWA